MAAAKRADMISRGVKTDWKKIKLIEKKYIEYN